MSIFQSDYKPRSSFGTPSLKEPLARAQNASMCESAWCAASSISASRVSEAAIVRANPDLEPMARTDFTSSP